MTSDTDIKRPPRRRLDGPLALLLLAGAGGLVLAALVALAGLSVGAALLAFAGLAVAAGVLRGRLERVPRPGAGAGMQARQDGDAFEIVGRALPEAFIAIDRNEVVVLANELALDLFPTLRKGQPLSSAIRAPGVLDALGRVLKSGGGAVVEFAQRVPVDRRFQAHLASVPGPGGEAVREAGAPAALMVVRDLTQAEKVERMRADFVANVSHELRTPLASVLGLVETLQGPARADKKAQAEFLELIRIQAGRMSRLISDLLSLSRIELKAHVHPRGEVDLAQTIPHVLDVLGPAAEAAGVKIDLSGLDKPLVVHGDRDELIQVFQNLIENAIKYGEAGGRVEIAAGREKVAGVTASVTRPPPATVSVRDFGPGIAPDHLPRLTERFYRVDTAESREKGGTGLGLAIVKHILNRHGARLNVTSEPGRGACFTIVFANEGARRDRPRADGDRTPGEVRKKSA